MKPKTNNLRGERRKRLREFLKQLREESGITQAALGKRLGRDQTFVSKYESGKKCLDLVEIMEFCDALGIALHRFCARWVKEQTRQ